MTLKRGLVLVAIGFVSMIIIQYPLVRTLMLYSLAGLGAFGLLGITLLWYLNQPPD